MGQEDDNETIRKGPWTEHEDVQLVFYVNMFGDRRWDFIAKVSGLKRNGKSCRLRWVNYLHPSLKRGKMAPHEERLVLELHSKWGNRWSKIAQKLPGRTDNEIKNYWRTHMRKKAQEQKRTTCSSTSPSLSNSSSSSSISSCNNPMFDVMTNDQTKKSSFYDTGGIEMVAITKGININKNNNKNSVTSVNSIDECYSMDEIWKDIDLLEDEGKKSFFDPYSKILDYSWMMDDQSEFDSRFFFQQASNFMNN